MDTRQKIEVLGRSAQYDLCGEACGTEANRVRDDLGRWIYPAVLPDGKRINLLKILLTNACENNCYYCANRAGRNFRRLSFTPEELAHTFDQMHRKGLVKGLFLSSGVCNAVRTMDRMIATVELVRRRYAFPGYVHLKILPGATFAHVERAVQLANRVSVNLEAPSPERLARIAPPKDFTAHLLQPLHWANRLIEEGQGRLASVSQTTQFVVGAAGESDRELLSTTARLYREVDLARVYFSAFQPIVDTPLEDHPPTPPLREHRLYQSDFLFRQYGFTFEDLVFDDSGNLPSEADPKLMWAQAHPECFPVEVNRASREELLRVPGIGPTSASRIIKLRRKGKFCELSDLRKIGAVAKRAAPFILLNGEQPPCQLSLWQS
ncbi:MAG: radical SAM protein [Anaerolineae bacterium]